MPCIVKSEQCYVSLINYNSAELTSVKVLSTTIASIRVTDKMRMRDVISAS